MIANDQLYKAKILIVDDQEISVRLLKEILEKGGYSNVTYTTDPREVRDLYIKLRPDCVALDLHMPAMDGFQVLSQLNKIEDETYLPVIILSSEDNSEMRYMALESGAKDFLNKPYDRVEVLIRIRNILEVRMLHNEIKQNNKILESKVRERTHELAATQLDVIQRLARSIEYRDSETGMHIIRMSQYSACLALKAGLSVDDCDLILRASPLHDIGKIGISDNILRKPGKLTPEEFDVMKTHTTIGGELLSGSNSKFLQIGRQIALTHHEKWNGKGYPIGLQEDQIPLVGRICGLCDVFDALTSERPYKKAWSLEETIEEIKKNKGSHFDPKLVEMFIEILPQIINIKERYADPNTHNS